MATKENKQKKQKVLYVITKSNFGGAQKYVYELALHIPRETYSVAVALGGTGNTNAETGILKKKLEEKNIRTILVQNFIRDMSPLRDIAAFFELLLIIRREKPDILHVTSSKAGGMGAAAGRLAGVHRIIFTSHGLAFDEIWRPRWQQNLIRLFSWVTILLSTKTILISQDTYERASLMPHVSKKVVLIHNGIHEPKFLPREDARRALLPDAEDSVYSLPWIGTIAEYHPNKNLHTLIETAALLKKWNIPAHVVLIGEGEQRRSLKALAEEHSLTEYVHCTGYIENAARMLKAFTIFALPSKKEGLPYVLLEAGFASLPVVTSNIPGIRDIIIDGETGMTVHVDAEVLAHVFESLLKDPTLCAQYGSKLREHVERTFSVERMVERTQELYSL